MSRYEELKTPEAVLAAFEAGRRVEYTSCDDGGFMAVKLDQDYGDGNYFDEVTDDFKSGCRYRALIESPALPAGYTPWGGGECPEDAFDRKTDVMFRGGTISTGGRKGRWYYWKHDGDSCDIIAYRVESEQAQADVVSDFHDGQWWMQELDAMVANGTPDQKRAVAVVRNLIRTANAQPSQQGKAVTDGYALVPTRMYVSPEQWDAAQFAFGGPGSNSEEPFYDCTLWVGEIESDDGSKTYGLHVSCDECPEEGSITLSEFSAAPLPIPAESLGRDAEGVEGLAQWIAGDDAGWGLAKLAVHCGAEDNATDDRPQTWTLDVAAFTELARRLRPQVNEAMVERACDAFLDVNPAAGSCGHKEMRAALTAALTEGDSHG